MQVLGVKRPIEHFDSAYIDEDLAMVIAYLIGHYTFEEIGAHYDRGRSTVSRNGKADEHGKWET
ncbi:MAG: hypothetical protein ACI9NT_002565 [Bacteroidia bacterium]